MNNSKSYHEESRLYTANAPDSVLVHWECSIGHYQTVGQMYTERHIENKAYSIDYWMIYARCFIQCHCATKEFQEKHYR